MGLAFDSTAGHLYAANLLADAVSVIDPASEKATSWTSGGGTWSVAVDPGVGQVYAVNSADGTVSILSTSDGSLKSKVSAGATGASVVAVNSATSMVYVSSGTLNGTVTVIDGNKDQMVTQIPVGETPVGIAIDETADRIYVANQHSATISVIDGASNQVIATWQPREGNVWKPAVDPALNRLYASIPPLNLLSFTGVEMLDSATGAFVTEVAAGSSAAEDVAVNPRTHHLFLTDQNNGTVAVIDGATNTVLQSLATGTSAYALAVDANSGLVYVSNPFDATIGVFADRPSGSSPPVVDSGGIVSAASGSAALSAGASSRRTAPV
jgi:YVTN family beta-propeller protein